MMRSLTLKLTAAFLLIGLIGVLLVAFFVYQRTQLAFNQFVADRGRTTLVTTFTQYYSAHSSWDGVDQVVPDDRVYQGEGDPHHMPIVLVAVDGRVILSDGRYQPGAWVSPNDRSRGVPLKVNGTVVGWLLSGVVNRPPMPGTPEGEFLQRISQALTYGAAGATGIALLLGILLARTLTHPLRELTAATQSVARGMLGAQVPVRSRDELGTLAISFNKMSKDLAHVSQLRRQMTADIAHDLRTPLSVILGYTEALREGKLPPSEEIYDTMYTEAQHLQHLVDDLRTLSLADAGELPLARQRVTAQALLERTAAGGRAQAQAREIMLRTDVAPDLPEIGVDPERMAQVLGNLLSNALRYTPRGGRITLGARRQAGSVQLDVSDTGSGIAAQDLPHVFERFYRGDASREQQQGSSGLGLAIARSLVEAHGGTISVESTQGSGTTFTILLPAAGAAPRRERQ